MLTDNDAAMLVLKQMCYHEIKDKQKFKIRPAMLKAEITAHTKRLLAKTMIGNLPQKLDSDCC